MPVQHLFDLRRVHVSATALDHDLGPIAEELISGLVTNARSPVRGHEPWSASPGNALLPEVTEHDAGPAHEDFSQVAGPDRLPFRVW